MANKVRYLFLLLTATWIRNCGFIKIPKYRSQSARLAPVFAGKGNSRPAASMETIGRMRNKKERKEEKNGEMEEEEARCSGSPPIFPQKKKEKVPLQYFAASAIA